MFPTVEEVCNLAISKFKSLPKTGKPTDKEWTIMSAVILHNKTTNSSKVVSLGTGTRSLPSSKYCNLGLIVNDSHAEVIAKRALQKYLYNELRKESGIFKFNEETKTFDLEDRISFHFYTSHVPCGDACIVENDEPNAKRLKTDEVYTGAKLLRKSVDKMSQEIGAVRLKPGKGEQTLSMSCSDKIVKWNVLGVQGSLLDSILSKPIYFETLNFGCDFDKEAVERAIWRRFDGSLEIGQRFVVSHPEVRKGGEVFPHSFDKDKNPSPNSIIWSDVEIGSLQVSVNGKKLGVGKKQFFSKKSSLDICRRLLFESYLEIVSSKEALLERLGLTAESIATLSYKEVKAVSKTYKEAWNILKKDYFKIWVEKNKKLQDFCSNSEYLGNGNKS